MRCCYIFTVMDMPTPETPQESAIQDYDFSEQVGHLLRRAYQRHTALFQQLIPDTQLTAAQFVVLCAVRDAGACSLSQIVKHTAIDQATVRGVIDRLKTRKLLAVRHNESDRRKVLVSLTPAGERLVQSMVPFAFDISEKTFQGFNPAERMALVYLLKKMCEADLEDSPNPLPAESNARARAKPMKQGGSKSK